MATANNCNVLPTLSTQRHALFGAVGAKRTRLGRQQHPNSKQHGKDSARRNLCISEFLNIIATPKHFKNSNQIWGTPQIAQSPAHCYSY